jgi:uncharacterized cupin superfamily protein
VSWFVRNIRDLEWFERPGRGFVSEFLGGDDQFDVNVFVLGPGESMSMYHWEADQEGYLVLSGEALLIVDDEEHPLRQWDYFHCPPPVPHTIVGAGDRPSAILALGARDHQRGPDWGGYPLSDVAKKHDASAEEETIDADVAYARFPDRQPGEFREDWLP